MIESYWSAYFVCICAMACGLDRPRLAPDSPEFAEPAVHPGLQWADE